jgi:hypothetical protein
VLHVPFAFTGGIFVPYPFLFSALVWVIFGYFPPSGPRGWIAALRHE